MAPARIASTAYRREPAVILLLVVIVLVVLVALWGVTSYNGLIKLRNLVQEAWRQIDVELTRRHDLIPNLVETVKGYAAHERDTLEDVMPRGPRPCPAARPRPTRPRTRTCCTQALGRLFAVAEAYPDLKANQNFLALQQELASTEDRIAAGRRYYNANVRELNTKVESVPSNIIAGLAHIGRAEYFEAEGAQREAPQVSFGGPGSGPGQIGGGTPSAPTTSPGPQDTVRPSSPLDPPPGR